DVFAGKKSAQIREILISESAWEEMTCLFAPSLDLASMFFIFCDRPSTTSLAVNRQSRYLLPVPANSGAGIGLPNIIPATYDALASFLCRAFGYTSMVGWAGAPQGAPV
ncbi:ash family protein, partial [Klebsiella grimontii]